MSYNPMIRNMKNSHLYPRSLHSLQNDPNRLEFVAYNTGTHTLSKKIYSKAVAIIQSLGKAILDDQAICISDTVLKGRLGLNRDSVFFENPNSDDLLAVNELILDRADKGYDFNEIILDQRENSFFHLISTLVRYSEEKLIFKSLLVAPKNSSQLYRWAQTGTMKELLVAEEAFGLFLSPEDRESFFNMMLDLYIRFHPKEYHLDNIMQSNVSTDVKANMILRLAVIFPEQTEDIISRAKLTKELYEFVVKNKKIEAKSKFNIILNSLNVDRWEINAIRNTIRGIGDDKNFLKQFAIYILTKDDNDRGFDSVRFIKNCNFSQEVLVDLIHASILSDPSPLASELLDLLNDDNKKLLYKELFDAMGSKDVHILFTLPRLDLNKFKENLPYIQDLFCSSIKSSTEKKILKLNEELSKLSPNDPNYKKIMTKIKKHGKELKDFDPALLILSMILNPRIQLSPDSRNVLAEHFDQNNPDLFKKLFTLFRSYSGSSHIVSLINKNFTDSPFIYKKALELLRLSPSERRLINMKIQLSEGKSMDELAKEFTNDFQDETRILELISNAPFLPDGEWKSIIVNKLIPGSLNSEEQLTNHYRKLADEILKIPGSNIQHLIDHLILNNQENLILLSRQLIAIASENDGRIDRWVFKLNKICREYGNGLQVILRNIEDPEVKYQAAQQYYKLHRQVPINMGLSEEEEDRLRAEFKVVETPDRNR